MTVPLILLYAVFLGVLASGFVRVNEPDPPAQKACSAQDCVPKIWLVRSEARSRKRLRLARKMEHSRNALRAALRASVSLNDPSGLTRGFLCIHGFEGSWQDPNPPYWGGVQMDRAFMRSYGANFYNAWGTADHWPPFVQLAVALNAYLSGRHWNPWPNTARYCGLLP